MSRLHNGQQVDYNCKYMAFGVSNLNNMYLLHTKM